MAIEPISFEDIGKPVGVGVKNIEPMTVDQLFGPTPTLAPSTAAPVEPTPAGPVKDIFGTEFRQPPTDIREMQRVQTDPFITREMNEKFAETLAGYESLADKPAEAVKGLGQFITAIPGFMLGMATAAQRMSKNLLDQVVVGQTFNLEEMYEVASEGMQAGFEFFDPAQKMLFGEPTPESQLVGATLMAPLTGLHLLGKEIAEFPMFKDSPNIRGAARFTGDLGGIAAMGMIIRGPRAEAARKMETVTKKAADIKTKVEIIDKSPDDAINRARKRVLEVEKQQLELEAAKVKENLDIETPIKEDLKAKGKKVKEIKKTPKVEIVQKPSVPAIEPKPVEVKGIEPLEGPPEIKPKAKPKAEPKETIPVEEVNYKTVKPELDEVFDLIGKSELKRKRKFRITVRDLKPGEKADVPATWHDGTFRFTVVRNPDGTLTKGAAGSYDTILSPGHAARGGEGVLPPEHTAYIVDLGPGDVRSIRIYRGPQKVIRRRKGIKEIKQDVKKIEEKGLSDHTNRLIDEYDALTEEADNLSIDIMTDEQFERFKEIQFRLQELNTELYNTEIIKDVDQHTGVDIPELEGKRSPFFQDAKETEVFKKLYEEKEKAVNENPELFAQKLINDVNRWIHGDESIDIVKVRDALSELAARGDELRVDFVDPADHIMWKDTVSDAAEWARRTERSEPGPKLSMMIPLDEVPEMVRRFISKAKDILVTTKEVTIEDHTLFGSPDGIDVVKTKDLYRNKKIFDETGFWLGKDGFWRFEIDDVKAKFNIIGSKLSHLLPKVLDYPELYEAAPKLKETRLIIDKDMKDAGTFNHVTNIIRLKSSKDKGTLLHEIQHAVNESVGAFVGGSVKAESAKVMISRLEKLYKKIKSNPDKYHDIAEFEVNDAIGRLKAIKDPVAISYHLKLLKENMEYLGLDKSDISDLNFPTGGMETYRRIPGEMEARLTEFRRHLSIKERKVQPPWKSLDTLLLSESIPFKVGEKLYSGLPLDEAGKAIVEGAKKFKSYVDKATGLKRFRPLDAARLLNQEFKRNFVDRSGNIRLDLIDKLGMKGYEIVQKMYLTKGANSLAANMLHQMRKEVYTGLSKSEKGVLDKLILAERMADIGKYKTPKEFAFPEGLTPVETAAYLELFSELEGLSPGRARVLQERARAHFEWMKKPLKDMLEAGLISKEEFTALSAHNYRKIKLVDIFDKQYQSKIGKKKMTIYDSGVEALAKGRTTDVYEPSSEIMALEVFNRAYGRILNNEANKSLAGLARNDPKNPFVRIKEGDQSIPSGWNRIFVFEEGERKAIYLSPEMSKEWITNNPDISYRMGQFLRYASGSPVLRTFATGINWGFALANLPRDVMHTWFAARMFDGKEWRGVYSNELPIFLPQIGMDLARTFTDAATKGPRYQQYIKEGGGMEFLVHQGRLFARGRRLEGPIDKAFDYLGYFGETSEIMTRLAIRDRVIRRRAKEKGISIKEANKDKDITREATFAARDYMDFGQGGGITKAADNALPYLSAAVQGTRGLWRVAAENPRTFAYKVAQLGAATTLVYAMAKENAPKTMEALQGSQAQENNLIIPLGDGFGFLDEKGQTRYPYLKIPMDPGQKFFKTVFEASYDKWQGNEVDIDRVTGSLREMSPVGISNLPPTFSATIGYMANKDFWRNEEIWRKTEPFDFPRSKEEFIPGKTSPAFTDLGRATGLSPERMQFAAEELTTSGTMWSYLAGKGYEGLFKEVPKEKREQHVAMTLSQIPVAKRFFGITNPYSKHAGKIDESEEVDTMERWIQTRELDRLTEGYLFEKSIERKEIFKYIRTFKEEPTRDRLMDRFDFQNTVKDLPERSFWLRLQGMSNKVRAEMYYDRWSTADEAERKQLAREAALVGAAGGFFSDGFWDEFNLVRRESSP